VLLKVSAAEAFGALKPGDAQKALKSRSSATPSTLVERARGLLAREEN
jgi:hypothetical protein